MILQLSEQSINLGAALRVRESDTHGELTVQLESHLNVMTRDAAERALITFFFGRNMVSVEDILKLADQIRGAKNDS
jgi:hypothetical protein